MAFEQLAFTKDWKNANDFPTYEPDEKQVREDLQFLYDEIRDFINNKLVAPLNSGGAGNISTESGKSIETVLAEIQEGLNNLAGGEIPEEGAALGWDLNVGGHRLINVSAPQDGTDAATRDYVDARRNKVVFFTLPADGWDAETLTQTVTVQGVLADANAQKVDLDFVDLASSQTWAESEVWCVSQGAYRLTFSCVSVPAADIYLSAELKEVTVL